MTLAKQADIRVLIVLAEATRGRIARKVSTLCAALARAGISPTVVSCQGPLPLPADISSQFLGIELDLAPHLLSFEETIDHIRRQLHFHDVVLSFQDVADIYPALERVWHRPALIEVGRTRDEALAGPKHFTTRYVALSDAACMAVRPRLPQGAALRLDLPREVDGGVGKHWVSLIRSAAARQEPAPPPSVFRSFFQGGFECSTMRWEGEERLDLLVQTGHDHNTHADFLQLRSHRIATVRDGLRWHLIEPEDGRFDLSTVTRVFEAQAATGTQVIWDLMHFGHPDFVDPFDPSFPARFARYAKVVGRHFREICGATPFWCPVNEISYHSWIAGEVGAFAPGAKSRGFELKRQLASAAIMATRALRAIDARARFLSCEPLISVRHDPGNPADAREAELFNEAQFQACDMLAGNLCPDLGGSPDCLDIVGLNYYPTNQWVHGAGERIRPDDDGYRPLRDLMVGTFARYGRPIVISETGTEGDGRADWLRHVHDEAMAARARGVPVEGICIYPVTDHTSWDSLRHCETGLLSDEVIDGRRAVHAPLADVLSDLIDRFDRSVVYPPAVPRIQRRP